MSRGISAPNSGNRPDEGDTDFFDEYDQRPEAEKRADLTIRANVQRRDYLANAPYQSQPADPIEVAYDIVEMQPTACAVSTSRAKTPPASAPALATCADIRDKGLTRLWAEINEQLDKKHKKARKELATVLARIELQEARCAEPAIADQLKQIEFARQKLLLSKGTALAERLQHEQVADRDLEAFKAQQRLTREPHYSTSRLFSAGVVLALILVEAGLNGVLFAENSEAGLLGGWTEAVVLAVANVGVAFLLGFLALRALNARNVLAKVAGGTALFAGLALILAINIFGAHYRDYKAEQSRAQPPASAAAPVETGAVVIVRPRDAGAKSGDAAKTTRTDKSAAIPLSAKMPSSAAGQHVSAESMQKPGVADAQAATLFAAERAAIARAISTPWAIESFNGLFLLVIGLCAAVLALIDGYKLDDPVPGYGRRHRRLIEARQNTQAAMQAALQEAGGLAKSGYEAIERSLQGLAREVGALKALHEEYASLHATWEKRLDDNLRDGTRALDHYRRQNRVLEPAALPSDWGPDALPDRHLKVLRAKEKTLRTMQAQIAAERDQLVAPFAGATAQFTTLMDAYGQRRLST